MSKIIIRYIVVFINARIIRHIFRALQFGGGGGADY